MQTDTFLNPQDIASVSNLSLRARLIVDGMIAGLHRSPYHGFSAEFSEYRQYRSGESSRLIDWRKFAKTDRPYIRLHEDETNLYAHILIDKSASMAYSSTGIMSKFEYARTIAASIARILVRQRDAVALAAFDETITTYLPPRSTNRQLDNILSTLGAMRPGAKTQCGNVLDQIADSIKKRGMSIVISDFLDEPELIAKGLRHLKFRRQDIICLWIIDPNELHLSEKHSYTINDMETGGSLFLDGKSAAEFLERGMRQHHAIIEDCCRELTTDLFTVVTDEPFIHSLIRILYARGKK